MDILEKEIETQEELNRLIDNGVRFIIIKEDEECRQNTTQK